MHLLSESELRVLGCLVEKQISTPDYYPLSLNALVNACNQKNQRDPVVAYTEADVQRALDALRTKQLAFLFEGAVARVPKFGHTFPKAYELDPAETALLCVLLLRGPQTPGELRSRAAYLHTFDSLPALEDTLNKLATRETPLVTKLPRTPGTKEARFAHLLGDEVKMETVAATSNPAETSAHASPPTQSSASSNSDRLAKLETEVAALREEFQVLKAKFGSG